jgi:hypothetical protein
MIKQLENSNSVGIPRDQKTARGALRMFGYFLIEEMRRWPERHPSPAPPEERSVEDALKDIYQPDE